MSWPEVQAALAAGKRTALLACGANEQHGPHLPTGTDAYLGTEIGVRAARKAGNALVAPTIRPGLSEHHMHFAGSFTLSIETFVGLLRDYVSSLARQGFLRVVVFPSHGGNTDTLRAHLPSIARGVAGRCELVLARRGVLAMSEATEMLAAEGISRGRAGAHAGYTETSMMLAHAPHLVHPDRFEPGRWDEDFYRPENIASSQMESFLHGIQTQSPNGILGDPAGSSADVGERILDLVADSIASDLAAPLALEAGNPANGVAAAAD